MVQGQRDLLAVAKLVLSELVPLVDAQQGIFYISETVEEQPTLKLYASYAYKQRRTLANQFKLGEGLVGQCALERQRILVTDIPESYIRISSGLGEAVPFSIVVLPVLFEDEVKAVIELASFHQFNDIHLAFLDQLTESFGIVLNTIAATMRTEELLKQSQALANMSHELRTPLNNLLILAKMLSENSEGNLDGKQVKFAETIYSSGADLLALITDILDLSKIESGTMTVEPSEVRLIDLQDYVNRTFRHVADGKGLEFNVELDPNAPGIIYTDSKRLHQIFKNLLSNALKFTERGAVTLRVFQALKGWTPDHPVLSGSRSVVGFSVADTGIGIASEKQKIVFEAFQQ